MLRSCTWTSHKVPKVGTPNEGGARWQAAITVSGRPVTSLDVATEAVSAVFRGPRHVEPHGAGLWQVDLPAEALLEVELSGGYCQWRAGAVEVEVEIP